MSRTPANHKRDILRAFDALIKELNDGGFKKQAEVIVELRGLHSARHRFYRNPLAQMHEAELIISTGIPYKRDAFDITEDAS